MSCIQRTLQSTSFKDAVLKARIESSFLCADLRFPLDGAVELHFSSTPEIRQPSPAPTPAVPTLDSTDDPVARWDSYEHLSTAASSAAAGAASGAQPDLDSDEDEPGKIKRFFRYLTNDGSRADSPCFK